MPRGVFYPLVKSVKNVVAQPIPHVHAGDMRYWTHSSGATSSRTFTLDEVREQLQTGQLSPSDRICLDGQTNWQRIEDAVPLDGPPPPPPGEPYGMPPLPGAATHGESRSSGATGPPA